MTFRALLLVAVAAVLAGCGGGEIAQVPATSREVRVDWLGQQSFRITSALGTKIVTNPYSSGFPDNQRPDIVLITTERSDSNNIDAFDNTPSVFRGAVGAGANTATGIRFRGIPTYKNPDKEESDNMNLVFVWTLDGIRFCFLGHLQHELTQSQVLQIGAVDVLFASPGAPGTLAATQLRARVVIPMGGNAGQFSKIYRLPGSSVLFTRETLPVEQTALVFGSP